MVEMKTSDEARSGVGCDTRSFVLDLLDLRCLSDVQEDLVHREVDV